MPAPIVSAALCLSLVMTPFVPVAAAYADEGSPAESSEIYVGVNYDENYDISLFLSAGAARIHIPRRGAILTDLQITAPSPHKVKLNEKEEACLRDL